MNMKFRNPKYLSMLNHLRFYLPEMYPKLHRILFLDDDIVVQKDLTGLWNIDMDGKVNGAVETCFGSFHRYAQYMNFSHPLIKKNFNPKACAWAYGMNFFDLDAWRKEKCTEQYHYWQNLNENRTLWKLGTLPPGLITYYSTTKPLDKSWHVLGLGYNPSISMDEINNAAVVHFNGNMKPWLDIAMSQFKPLWTKYVDYENERISPKCSSQPPLGCGVGFLILEPSSFTALGPKTAHSHIRMFSPSSALLDSQGSCSVLWTNYHFTATIGREKSLIGVIHDPVSISAHDG
ncbi:Galacturonosyltransferase 8-like protein [Drosera capensis]